MAENYSTQLDGLILGEILTNLQVLNSPSHSHASDSEGEEREDTINSVKNKLGLKTNKDSFTRESIFNNKFEDDPYADGINGEEGDGVGGDLESQVDREMYKEKYGKSTSTLATATTTSTSTATGSRALRGEDENYSSDEDSPPPSTLPSTTNQTQTQIIKPEPTSPPPFPLPSSRSSPPPEEDRYRAVTPTIIQTPAIKKSSSSSVKELFPSFERGKVLDFTDLFGVNAIISAGSKRAGEAGGGGGKRSKLNGNPNIIRTSFFLSSSNSSSPSSTDSPVLYIVSLPTLDSLPRSKSTRDLLTAPLKLHQRTANNIRLKELAMLDESKNLELDVLNDRNRRGADGEEEDDEELLESIEVSF